MESALERQARHYWRMMTEGGEVIEAVEFRDEMDTLGKLTDSPVLKNLCGKNMRRFDGRIRLPMVASGR